MIEALLGFMAVFFMAFLRIPLAVAMAIAGMVGMGLLRGWTPAFASTSQVIFETGFHYVLSVIPLFVLMGNLVARAGMARELFTAANAFVGHRKGGLAMASIIASGGFGSICGSSIATAATMTRVAYPEMKSHGYKDTLATGAIAAGGTLGILIPPSTILVIYGIITETDIGKLFVAGILPGLLAITCLCLGVVYVTWRDPEAGPRAERFTWAQRLTAIRGIWGVVVLFGLVIGGIYGGVFTATEGAGVGAAGAFFFALLRGSLTPRVLMDILVESTRTTAMLFTILIAAMIFTNFINFTSMPGDLRDFVLQFSPHPVMVVVMMMGIYLMLGMVMEELAIVLLTIPVFFPVITGLGFDPVWFGILIVTIVEIGMISPPVGLNLFVINSLLPKVKLGTIYRGVWPFVMADIVRLGILIAFPAIALWLPGFMTR
ncbi:TRAP transporter large permease [Hydrogenophaga sp.]|uniref:TRAP transporter large permease n=1 Tax=Hydrogenophaga sp. TaxID=1904254 RepID=UPI00272EFC37|nr:TRAP transporter large permease [Hydrogenophaga sp.]MDP2075195.1 TRAP transporter large permease [Hydrogenophaga sp.]MDP3109940.1 TRAP transporter large permease [Hydrogenophaga sp.]MDP3348045.1 TRAP transporter large permease [Hydrogenophaga sp.]MDZ4282919.1 TRAP transporter large permease [Hydrogenophaga sp.]MDZ4396360.1 TRAP transporter large permease [Hydrogenophaga sp.]